MPIYLTPLSSRPPNEIRDFEELQEAVGYLRDYVQQMEDRWKTVRSNFDRIANERNGAKVAKEDFPRVGHGIGESAFTKRAVNLSSSRFSQGLKLADGSTRARVNVSFEYLGVGSVILGNGTTTTLTADLTVAGAGGLRAGLTEAANTWYAVYIIASDEGESVLDDTNSPPIWRMGTRQAAFLDTATTPVLPAGYNRFRRVGWVRNNGTSDFFRFVNAADDHWFFYNEDIFASPFLVVNTIAAPTIFTDVDCSPVAPSTSRMVMLGGDVFDSAVAVAACYTRSNDLPNVTANPPTMVLYQEINPAPTGVHRAGGSLFQLIDSSQIFEYRGQVATNNIRLAVLGYRDVR